jgi:iron complex transport system ATP-binding protein
VIAARGLSIELGGRDVVDRIDLDVGDGEWVTVIGPNGAGKTTLLRAIAGLVPARGTIEVGGCPITRLSRRALAKLVAFVPQLPFAPTDMTVSDYVLLGRTPHIAYFGNERRSDVEAARRALATLDLAGLADRRLGTLSGGERQRAVLARALAQEAPVLLLDEPTSSLDAGRQQDALELIDALRLDAGLTVVATMHDLTLAGQYATRLVLLSTGRIVAQGAAEEVLNEALIAEHYGATVRVVDGAVIPVRR